MLVQSLKLISNAPDGLEKPLVRHALQLFAESLDVHVNGTRVAEIIESPNLVEKLIASENAIAV